MWHEHVNVLQIREKKSLNYNHSYSYVGNSTMLPHTYSLSHMQYRHTMSVTHTQTPVKTGILSQTYILVHIHERMLYSPSLSFKHTHSYKKKKKKHTHTRSPSIWHSHPSFDIFLPFRHALPDVHEGSRPPQLFGLGFWELGEAVGVRAGTARQTPPLSEVTTQTCGFENRLPFLQQWMVTRVRWAKGFQASGRKLTSGNSNIEGYSLWKAGRPAVTPSLLQRTETRVCVFGFSIFIHSIELMSSFEFWSACKNGSVDLKCS